MYDALALIANALIIRHGRIVGDQALLTSLATGLVCNRHGSEVIGEMITPFIREAVNRKATACCRCSRNRW